MKAVKNINGRRVILALVFVAAAIVLVRHNVGTCSIVKGDSMYPTFSPNDVVQATSSFAKSKRGDVVIITDDRGDRAIKRIIGLPGETVTIYRGFVYINGQRLNEPYLPQHTYTFESNTQIIRRADWRLGENEFFVMGDNRLQSYDSRRFGPVESRNIQGVVDLPGNAARPVFGEIMLSESGKVVRGKQSPNRNQTRNTRPNSNAKI